VVCRDRLCRPALAEPRLLHLSVEDEASIHNSESCTGRPDSNGAPSASPTNAHEGAGDAVITVHALSRNVSTPPHL
jgi:hypothetical protein